MLASTAWRRVLSHASLLQGTVRRVSGNARTNLIHPEFCTAFELKSLQNRVSAHILNVEDMTPEKLAMVRKSVNDMLRDNFSERQQSPPLTIDEFWNRPDIKVEVAINIEKMEPLAVIVHQFTRTSVGGSEVAFYHPKLWAISDIGKKTGYTGLGIIPTLMNRFAYYLQFSNPELPCYMAIPVFAPWTARMLNIRYQHFIPRTNMNDALSLTDQQNLLLAEAMHAFMPNQQSRKSDNGYPLYELPRFVRVTEKKFENSYYSHPETLASIREVSEFCQALFPCAYDSSLLRFTQEGYLSLLPCSAANLATFCEAWTDAVTDYQRVFNTPVPPDHLVLDASAHHPVLTDLRALCQFNTSNFPQLDSLDDVDEILRETKHAEFPEAGSKQKSKTAEKSQRIERSGSKLITFEGRLPDTQIDVLVKGKKKRITTKIMRVRNIPPEDKAFLLDQIHPIAEECFEGGSFLKREEFKKRLERLHGYIEVIYNSENLIVGFMFHEVFEGRVKTAADDVAKRDLNFIVLKTGLSCLTECDESGDNYQSCGIATFLLRRFYLRLQLEFPNMPCFNHFTASDQRVLCSELCVEDDNKPTDLFLDGFYPAFEGDSFKEPSPSFREPSPREEELMRTIFRLEVLAKYQQGGDALRGMLRHVDSLGTIIPYPILPKTKSVGPKKNSTHVRGERWSKEEADRRRHVSDAVRKIYEAKKARTGEETAWYYKGPGGRQSDHLEETAPAARCFSRLSEGRSAAYLRGYTPEKNTHGITVVGIGSKGGNPLEEGVKVLCQSYRSKAAFQHSNLSFEDAVSKLIPESQEQVQEAMKEKDARRNMYISRDEDRNRERESSISTMVNTAKRPR